MMTQDDISIPGLTGGAVKEITTCFPQSATNPRKNSMIFNP
jgi:hypothetical protein